MRRILMAALGCALTIQAPQAHARKAQNAFWRQLQFQPASEGASNFEAATGTYRLTLSNPNDKSEPKLWDSALTIVNSKSRKSCSSEPLLIAKVYALHGAKRFVVVSNSGSLTWIDLIDASTCRSVQRIKTLTEGVEARRERIAILPGCECAEAAAPCSCSAGQVLQLGGDGKLRLLNKESDALTKEKLGVAFRGERKLPNRGATAPPR